MIWILLWQLPNLNCVIFIQKDCWTEPLASVKEAVLNHTIALWHFTPLWWQGNSCQSLWQHKDRVHLFFTFSSQPIFQFIYQFPSNPSQLSVLTCNSSFSPCWEASIFWSSCALISSCTVWIAWTLPSSPFLLQNLVLYSWIQKLVKASEKNNTLTSK